MLKDGGLSERICFQANKEAKAIGFGCAAGTMTSKRETLKMKIYGQCYCFSAQKWQGLEKKSSKIPSPKTYELE